MGKAVKVIFLIFSVILLTYLLLPEPSFPQNLPKSHKSNEPGDMEDPMRIAFYTDMTRSEVIYFYEEQFINSGFGIRLPQLRLNYPPEEAQTLIRDQTASTFLEQLVHPLRESIYINGYEPSVDKNPLVVEGKTWRQKITIKYIKSNPIARILIGVLTLCLLYILYKEYKQVFSLLIKRR